MRAILALPLLILLAALPATGAPAQPAGGGSDCVGRPGPVQIWVTVQGLRSSDGLVAITV